MDEDRFENEYTQEPTLDELLRDAHETLDEPLEDLFADDVGYPEYSGKAAELLPEEEPVDVYAETDAVRYDDVPTAVQTYEQPDYDDVLPAQERASEVFEPDFGDAFDDFGDYDDSSDEQEQQQARRHLKRQRFPKLIFAAVWIVIVIGLSVLLANFIWSCVDDAAALTRPDQNVEIVINDGDDLDTVTKTLKEAGAIDKEWLFKLYCHVTHKENFFDPGVYQINLTYDYHALVNNLMASSGNRETVTVMVMEGLDCYEIFDLLEENGVCSRAALEEAAANSEFDYAFLEDRPYGDGNRLEGYLFPDTYEFYLNDEPENVLARFLDNFEDKMDEEVMALVEASGYTLHEVLAMASIIEGEAANDKERPDVASVMYNRMNNWEYPLLGMDSTVNYAAKLLGVEFSTSIDSPYNTYRYPGLPAGPINNPGMNSIMAVLQPNDTDYYYFATAKDGLNRFFKEESAFNEFINSDEYIGNSTETTDD